MSKKVNLHFVPSQNILTSQKRDLIEEAEARAIDLFNELGDGDGKTKSSEEITITDSKAKKEESKAVGKEIEDNKNKKDKAKKSKEDEKLLDETTKFIFDNLLKEKGKIDEYNRIIKEQDEKYRTNPQNTMETYIKEIEGVEAMNRRRELLDEKESLKEERWFDRSASATKKIGENFDRKYSHNLSRKRAQIRKDIKTLMDEGQLKASWAGEYLSPFYIAGAIGGDELKTLKEDFDGDRLAYSKYIEDKLSLKHIITAPVHTVTGFIKDLAKISLQAMGFIDHGIANIGKTTQEVKDRYREVEQELKDIETEATIQRYDDVLNNYIEHMKRNIAKPESLSEEEFNKHLEWYAEGFSTYPLPFDHDEEGEARTYVQANKTKDLFRDQLKEINKAKRVNKRLDRGGKNWYRPDDLSGLFRDRISYHELFKNDIHYNKIDKKLKESGEEALSEEEKDFIREYNNREELYADQLVNSYWYNVSTQTRLSVEMMAEQYILERIIGKLGNVVKASVRGAKGLATGKKVLYNPATSFAAKSPLTHQAAKSATAASGSSLTWRDYYEERTNSLQIIKTFSGDELLLSGEDFKILAVQDMKEDYLVRQQKIESIKNDKTISDEVKETLISQLEMELEAIEANIEELVDEDGNLRLGEQGKIRSFLKAWNSNANEFMTESVGGHLIDKALGRATSGLRRTSSRIVKGTSELAQRKAGLAKVLNAGESVWDFSKRAGAKAMNTKFGRGAKAVAKKNRVIREGYQAAKERHLGRFFRSSNEIKLLNSIPSEILEEMLESVLPSYGVSFDEYLDELGETIFDSQFYSDVIGSTLQMSLGGYGVRAAVHYSKMKLNSEYAKNWRDREERKQILLRHIDILDQSMDPDTAEIVAMNTLDTVSDPRRILYEVARIRSGNHPATDGMTQEERELVAEMIEERTFSTMVKNSLETGLDEELEIALENIVHGAGATQTDRKNAQLALNQLNELRGIMESYDHWINRSTIRSLKLQIFDSNNEIRRLKNAITEENMKEFEALVSDYNENKARDSSEHISMEEIYKYLDGTMSKNEKVSFETEKLGGLGVYLEGSSMLNTHSKAHNVFNILKQVQDNIDLKTELQESLDYQLDVKNFNAIYETEAQMASHGIMNAVLRGEETQKSALKKLKAIGQDTAENIKRVQELEMWRKTNQEHKAEETSPRNQVLEDMTDRTVKFFEKIDQLSKQSGNKARQESPEVTEKGSMERGTTSDKDDSGASAFDELFSVGESPSELQKLAQKEKEAYKKHIENDIKAARNAGSDLADLYKFLVGKYANRNPSITERHHDLFTEIWNEVIQSQGKSLQLTPTQVDALIVDEASSTETYNFYFGAKLDSHPLSEVGNPKSKATGGEISTKTLEDENEKRKKEDNTIEVPTPEGVTEQQANDDAEADLTRRPGIGLFLGRVSSKAYELGKGIKKEFTKFVKPIGRFFSDSRVFNVGDATTLVFDFSYLTYDDTHDLQLGYWTKEDENDKDSNNTKRTSTNVKGLISHIFKDVKDLNLTEDQLKEYNRRLNEAKKEESFENEVSEEDFEKEFLIDFVQEEIRRLAELTDKLILNSGHQDTQQDYVRELNDSFLFRNEEFLKYVPIGMMNPTKDARGSETIGYTDKNKAAHTKENGKSNMVSSPNNTVIHAGLYEYHWHNNDTTGVSDPAERALRIAQNKKINLNARKAILQKGFVDTSITKKDNNRENRISDLEDSYYIFNSLKDSFKSFSDFRKTAAVVFLYKESGVPVIRTNTKRDKGEFTKIKIDGVEVTFDMLDKGSKNYWLEADVPPGAPLIVYKAGVKTNKDGTTSPIYRMGGLVTNHASAQIQMKLTNRIISTLFNKINALEQSNDETDRRKRKELEKIFEKILALGDGSRGLNLVDKTVQKNLIFELYPTVNKDSATQELYQQATFNQMTNEPIIDILGYIKQYGVDLSDESVVDENSKVVTNIVDKIMEDLLKNPNEVLKTTKMGVHLGNFHIDQIFTAFETTDENGKEVTEYSVGYQPTIELNENDFEVSDNQTVKDLVSINNDIAFLESEIYKNRKTLENDDLSLSTKAREVLENKIKSDEKKLSELIKKEEQLSEKLGEESKSKEAAKRQQERIAERKKKITAKHNRKFKEETKKPAKKIKKIFGLDQTQSEEIQEIQDDIDTLDMIITQSGEADYGNEAEPKYIKDTRVKLATKRRERKEKIKEYQRENKDTPGDFNEVSIEEHKDFMIQEIVFMTLSNTNIDETISLDKLYEKLEDSYNFMVRLAQQQGLKEEEEFLITHKDAILGNDRYEESAKEYLHQFLQVGDMEDFLGMDHSGMVEKNFDQSSFEMDIYGSLGAKVKSLFSGIQNRNKKVGMLGLNHSLGIYEVMNALRQALAMAPNNDIEGVKAIMQAQAMRSESNADFYNAIIERLDIINHRNPEIISEILYKLYQSDVSMKFVLWSEKSTLDPYVGYSDSSIVLEVHDANVKNPLFVKRNEWMQKLKKSEIIDMYDENKYSVNENAYKDVLALAEALKEAETIEEKVNIVATILDKFGIDLKSQTYNSILTRGTENNTYKGEKDLKILDDIFESDNSFLQVVLSNLTKAKNSQTPLTFDKDVRGAETFNILTNDNNQLNDLIRADNFAEFRLIESMYIAGKSIDFTQQNNAITNTIADLQKELRELIPEKKELNRLRDAIDPEDQETIDAFNEFEIEYKGRLKRFKESPLTSNSFLLELLESDPLEASQYLDTFLMSLESLKERSTTSRDDMSITDLNDPHLVSTMLAMFAHNEGKFTNTELERKFPGLEFRKGYISFPTLSDAGQMMMLKTILLNIDKSSWNEETNRLDDKILEILRTQVLDSDLLRMVDFFRIEGMGGSNIKGYDTGAKFITNMTSLNTVLVKTGTEGSTETIPLKLAFEIFAKERLNSLNKEDNKLSRKEQNELIVKEFTKKYNTEILNEINKEIVDEAKNFEKTLTSLNIASRGKMTINSDFDSKKDFFNKGSFLTSLDYIVNNFLQQKEIQTLFAGDIASYFNDNLSRGLEADGMPKIYFEDILKEFYTSSEQADIREIIGKTKLKDLDEDQKEELLSKYPMLVYIPEIGQEVTEQDDFQDNKFKDLKPIYDKKLNEIMKNVQNNLSKRLKGLISPGNQLVNSKNQKDYIQLMVEDANVPSKNIKDYIERFYPEMAEKAVPLAEEYQDLSFNHPHSEVKDRKKQILEGYYEYNDDGGRTFIPGLEQMIPSIVDYLQIESTDAQEYTSWGEALDQLLNQGRISPTEYKEIEEVFHAQEAWLDAHYANLDENTEGLSADQTKIEEFPKMPEHLRGKAILQTTKPLATGLIDTEVNGHRMQRFIYVKSSSIAITPELAFLSPKMNNLRKLVKRIETQDSGNRQVNVRISFQSANKVGAVKNPISLDAIFSDYENIGGVENLDLATLKEHWIEIPRENFYIQQDKPYKADQLNKQGKEIRVTRASQFEKIILGDGINKLGHVFDSKLIDPLLLEEFGIQPVDGKISGEDLKTFYNKIYEKEQKALLDKFQRDYGIENTKDIENGKPEALEKLAKELNKRLPNKQDRKALELVYEVVTPQGRRTLTKQEFINSDYEAVKAMFRFPLHMSPNARKFEAVFNSLINKAFINLELPGQSYPVASEAGFDMRNYTEEVYESIKRKGGVFTEKFDYEKGLQAVRNEETGELSFAQVFAPNRLRKFNKKTGEFEFIDLRDYMDPETNLIDSTKIPEDLLTMFSFRIPTSSHQSGTMIEIVGFLPESMGDAMIVPGDHTVQIGEDFDIDMRYAYQYHITEDENGNLKKISMADVSDILESYRDIKGKYNLLKDEIKDLGSDNYRNSDKILKEVFNREMDKIWEQFYETTENEDGSTEIRQRNPYLENNKNIIKEISFLNFVIQYMNSEGLDKIDNFFPTEKLMVDQNDIKEEISALTARLLPVELVPESYNRLYKEFNRLNNMLTADYLGKKSIIEDYLKAVQAKKIETQAIENSIVGLYKTVFSSNNKEVQKMITSVLNTNFSQLTADEIQNKKDLIKESVNFNIHSPLVQMSILKAGADGKFGIGVHSNSVTQHSIFQQLARDRNLQLAKRFDKNKRKYVPYDIALGKLVFDGKLGKVFDSQGNRISEYLMQSQNASLDNQKLEIMYKRNENEVTIGVFTLLQMMGIEDDGEKIKSLGNKTLSYASLFISQPILDDYTRLIQDSEVFTSRVGKDKVFRELRKYALEMLDQDTKNTYFDKTGNWLFESDRGEIITDKKKDVGETLISPLMYDMIGKDIADMTQEEIINQIYIFDTFVELLKPAEDIVTIQMFTNIEARGMGETYFDTINLKNSINNIINLDIISNEYFEDESVNIDLTPIGEQITTTLSEYKEKYEKEGYEILEWGEEGSTPGETEVYISQLYYGPIAEQAAKITKGPFTNMFGEIEITRNEDRIEELLGEGYHFISENDDGQSIFVKPENHYAHKIFNSLSQGYNLWNSLFPYDNPMIEGSMRDIAEAFRINLETKAGKKLRYKILEGYKDYSIVVNNQLFEQDLQVERYKLFSDVEGENESLAAYLLRMKSDPEFGDIFSNSMFADMSFILGQDGEPSIIKVESGRIHGETNLLLYNSLRRMTNSKRELPPMKYSNEIMTEEKLMEKLLKYSLMANQEGSAIGFRHLLPMELLSKYNVDGYMRGRADHKKQLQYNLIYNGPQKTLEAFLNSSGANERGVIKNSSGRTIKQIIDYVNTLNKYVEAFYKEEDMFLVDHNTGDVSVRMTAGLEYNRQFVRQFIQHNSEMIPLGVSDESFVDGTTIEEVVSGEVSQVHIQGSHPFRKVPGTGLILELIDTIPQRYWDSSLGVYSTREIGVYQTLNTYGSFGINEYQAFNERGVNNPSIITGNNTNPNAVKKEEHHVDLNNLTFKEELMKVESATQIIEDFIGNKKWIINGKVVSHSQRYGALMNLFDSYVDSDKIRVEFSEEAIEKDGKKRHAYNAKYSDRTKTITFNKLWLQQEHIDSREIERVFMEEYMHAITTEVMGRYIDTKSSMIRLEEGGKIVYDVKYKEGIEIPQEIEDLVELYEYGVNKYLEENTDGITAESFYEFYEKFFISKDLRSVGSVEEHTTYRMGNFHEFVASVFLTDEPIGKFMGELKSPLESKKSVLRNFFEALANLFKKVFPDAFQDSVTADIADSLMSVVESIVKEGDSQLLVSPAFRDYGETGTNNLSKDQKEAVFKTPSSFKTLEEAQDTLKEAIKKEMGGDYKLISGTVSIGNVKFSYHTEKKGDNIDLVLINFDTFDESIITINKKESEKHGTIQVEEVETEVENSKFVKGEKAEVFKGEWTREDVENNPDKIFLFGDNTEDRTKTRHIPNKSQAVVRGLPNTIGIDTKKDRWKNEGNSSVWHIRKTEGKQFRLTKKIKEGIDEIFTRYRETYDIFEGFTTPEDLYRSITKESPADDDVKYFLDRHPELKEEVAKFINENTKNTEIVYHDVQSSYLSNEDLDWFKKHVDTQIERAKAMGKIVVLPEGGIGTGLARLHEESRKELFDYLNNKLMEEFGFNNKTGEIISGDLSSPTTLADILRGMEDSIADSRKLSIDDLSSINIDSRCK